MRALAAGFGIVLVLMGAASGVALQQAAIVRKSAEGLVREQLLMARLLNEVQLEEKALTEELHRVARSPSQLDRAELLADLAHADSALERLATETAHTHEALTWAELQRCAASFTQEVRRVLRGSQKAAREEIDGLFVLHDRVVQLSRQLLDDTTEHLRAAEALIESESRTLSSELGLLLGSSFLIAGACAAGTLAYARQSIRQIESQSDELDRVSWHMLQTQEALDPRFCAGSPEDSASAPGSRRRRIGRDARPGPGMRRPAPVGTRHAHWTPGGGDCPRTTARGTAPGRRTLNLRGTRRCSRKTAKKPDSQPVPPERRPFSAAAHPL